MENRKCADFFKKIGEFQIIKLEKLSLSQNLIYSLHYFPKIAGVYKTVSIKNIFVDYPKFDVIDILGRFIAINLQMTGHIIKNVKCLIDGKDVKHAMFYPKFENDDYTVLKNDDTLCYSESTEGKFRLVIFVGNDACKKIKEKTYDKFISVMYDEILLTEENKLKLDDLYS